MRHWRSCGLLVAATVAAASALAQPASPAPGVEIASSPGAADDKRTGRARFFDPDDGQLDLSYFLEHPLAFLPIPIIVTEPAVGYGGGVAGMFIRPRREAGEEGWARPDISAVGALVTQNGTWATFGGDVTRWLDGRLRTLAGGGTGQINQGDRMASFEIEARWQFYGRWSAVAFGGAGTARTHGDGFSVTQNVGSGGVGIRYELARKFGMHVGVDVAHSPGTTAVYLQVGNAWFRP